MTASSLYPFLGGAGGNPGADLDVLLEQVRRSTVAKAQEITALRPSIAMRARFVTALSVHCLISAGARLDFSRSTTTPPRVTA